MVKVGYKIKKGNGVGEKKIRWELRVDTEVRITPLRGKYLIEARLSGSSSGYPEPVEYFPPLDPRKVKYALD